MDVSTLAAHILELEGSFSKDGAPPDESTASEWFRLISELLTRLGRNVGDRTNLRVPTDAELRYRCSAGTRSGRCTGVGHGGLTLVSDDPELRPGAYVEILDVDDQGKSYDLGIPAQVRWVEDRSVGQVTGVAFAQVTRSAWASQFFAWYRPAYQTFLRAVASGEITPETSDGGEAPVGESSNRGERHTPRLLIVDDEEANRDVLERIFRTEYDVYQARDGDEALSMAREIRPHVVITDQRMPNRSGVEFLKLLKVEFPETVRVLITAHTDHEALVDAVNYARIHHYFEKPVDAEALKSIVTKLSTHAAGDK